MAKTLYTGSVTVGTQGGSSNAYVFDAEVIENTTSTELNSSNVTCNLYAKAINGWGYSSHWTPTAYINIDGNRKSTEQISSISSTRKLLCTWTGNIVHGDDGKKSIRVTFNFSPEGDTTYYIPASAKLTADPVNLTDIPRYTSITTFTLSKRNYSTLRLNWGTADTVDYIWYRYKKSTASSYSSWVGVDVTDGTSGTVDVNGLSANTTYNFQLRVRRKDSQLTTDSSSDATQTTYQIPTQSFNTKTETSVTMNWSCDVTADYVWYSKDNGANWIAVGSVNATSGSYTINGLNPATSYNIKTRIRRSATQVTDDTSAMSVTTLAVPVFLLRSKTETSFNIEWVADSTIDYVWYSTNNGSTYTGLDVTDNTSGTFTINSLSAATTYNVKMKFRRKATQTTYEVASQSLETYDYPHITEVEFNPLIIGDSQRLELYNPLSRNVTIKMYKDNTSGTELYSGTTSSTGTSITPNANTLYSSIPNDEEGNCVYSVKYGNVTRTTEVKKYQIKGNEYPTFNTSDFSYSADKTELTNNNQLAIEKYATLTISIDNEATSDYGTTIDRYVVKWGDKTLTISNGTTGTITGGSGNTLIVTAYDKRGLPKEVSKTITNFTYSDIDVSSISTPRTNGVDAEVKLNISGRLYNGKFGNDGITNTLYSAKYWTSTNQTFSGDGYSIPISNFSISNGIFSLSDYVIHANGSSGGFTIGIPYYVKVEIKDAQGLLASVTKISSITDGKISRSVFKTSDGNYHQGINGLPDSDVAQKIYGKQRVTSSIATNNKTGRQDGIAGVIMGEDDVNGSIELSGNTPYIDFHYNNSTSDYTSRIIENASGTLNINGLTVNNGVIGGTVFTGKIRLVKTNPSSSTYYYIPFTTGGENDTDYSLLSNDGLKYETREGTTSAHGFGELTLGNTIAAGTAGNKRGYLRLCGEQSYNVELTTADTMTTHRVVKFPDAGGTIALLNTIYPVGSIIETYTSTNPNGTYGGTWQRYGTGRVTVDLDTSDSNFNTIGKTGGANSNSTKYTPAGTIGGTAISIAQMPKHQHDVGNYHSSGENYDWTPYMCSSVGTHKGWRTNVMTNYAGSGSTHNHGWTGTEATISISALQKYITVYRWRRTA